MTAIGTPEWPDTVWLVEWTDIFGQERRALSLQKRDVEAMRTVDSEARIVEGKVSFE